MASAAQLDRERKPNREVSPAKLVPHGSARLLSAEDVAAITGLSTETLAQWRSQRKGIPFLKLSRNVVRYQQGDLDAWLAQRIVRVETSIAERRL